MFTQIQLKIVAVVLMVIDHIGLFLFPQQIVLRAVGRLSFPLFAYFFAQGYQHTNSHSKYLFRLLVTGLVAQVVLGLPCQFNILLTFSYNLVLLKLVEKSRPEFKSINLIIGALLCSFFNFDFGWYATAIISLFLEFKPYQFKLFSLWGINWVVLNGLSFLTIGILQPLAVFSLFFILETEIKPDRLRKFTQIAFYGFYPIHLAALGTISKILSA